MLPSETYFRDILLSVGYFRIFCPGNSIRYLVIWVSAELIGNDKMI